MLTLLETIWIYRTEILLAIQILQKMRKTAQEVAREYVRRKVETKLKQSLMTVGGQILVLVALYYFNEDMPGLFARCIASLALWGITLFNLGQLTLITIPELRALYRLLRGKTGYALKFFLEVSLVTELLRLNVLFLAFCLVMGISGRTAVGNNFSYLRPWQELWEGHPPTAPRHRRHRKPDGEPDELLGPTETVELGEIECAHAC